MWWGIFRPTGIQLAVAHGLDDSLAKSAALRERGIDLFEQERQLFNVEGSQPLVIAVRHQGRKDDIKGLERANELGLSKAFAWIGHIPSLREDQVDVAKEDG